MVFLDILEALGGVLKMLLAVAGAMLYFIIQMI